MSDLSINDYKKQNAYYIIDKMLLKRGYNKNEKESHNTFTLYENNEQKKIFVFQQIFNGHIKNFRENFTININRLKIRHAIIITHSSYIKDHKTALKKQYEVLVELNSTPKPFIEFFSLDMLQYDLTEHNFVPEHKRLTGTELERFKKTLPQYTKLPKLLTSDAISRYYNFKHCDIIRIKRKNVIEYNDILKKSTSKTNLDTITYRYVQHSKEFKLFQKEIKIKNQIKHQDGNYVKQLTIWNKIEENIKKTTNNYFCKDYFDKNITNNIFIRTLCKDLGINIDWLYKTKTIKNSKIKHIVLIKDLIKKQMIMYNNLYRDYIVKNLNDRSLLDKAFDPKNTYMEIKEDIKNSIVSIINSIEDKDIHTIVINMFESTLDYCFDIFQKKYLIYYKNNTQLATRILDLKQIVSEDLHDKYIDFDIFFIKLMTKIIQDNKIDDIKKDDTNVDDNTNDVKEDDDELDEIDDDKLDEIDDDKLDEIDDDETNTDDDLTVTDDDVDLSEIDIVKTIKKNKDMSVDIDSFDIEPPPHFALYKHQKDAISFLKERKKKRKGGVLYHEMGLGKTITSSFYAIEFLEYNNGMILVIVPKSTVFQWISEIVMIIKHKQLEDQVSVFEMNEYSKHTIENIKNNMFKKTIVVTTFSQIKIARGNQQLITKPDMYDMAIIDEIHEIRNAIPIQAKDKLPKYVTSIEYLHKAMKQDGHIVGLTGTPFINNMRDICSILWTIKETNMDTKLLPKWCSDHLKNEMDDKNPLVQHLFKDQIEQAKQKGKEFKVSKIHILFRQASHIPNVNDVKSSNKPKENMIDKYIDYKGSSIKNDVEKIIFTCKKTLSQTKSKKIGYHMIKKLLEQYYLYRTMGRLLNSCGVKTIVHKEQKQWIREKIETLLLTEGKQLTSPMFWKHFNVNRAKQIKDYTQQLQSGSQDKKSPIQKWIDKQDMKQQHLNRFIKSTPQEKLDDVTIVLNKNKVIAYVMKDIMKDVMKSNQKYITKMYFKPKQKYLPDDHELVQNMGRSYLTSILKFSPSNKIKTICKDATEFITTKQYPDNLLVIASEFVITLKIIQHHFGKKIMKIYDGSLSVSERKQMIRDFHKGKFSILGLSKQSGGTGLNIGKGYIGNKMIFVRTMYIVEPSDSYFKEEQVKSRILRLGMGGKCDIIRYIYTTTSLDSMDQYMMKNNQLKFKSGNMLKM